MRTPWILGAIAGLGLVAVIACGGSTDSDGGNKATGGAGGSAASGGKAGSGGGGSGGGAGVGGASGGTGATGGNAGSGGGGGGPASCGGLAEMACAPDEFCDYPDNSYCGGDDSQGVCVKKPQACDENCPGVCGCDSKFYCNSCIAQQNGVDVSMSTTCKADGGQKLCGGYGGIACAANEWCDLPNGCGYPDATGICKMRPEGCTADCPGVCGCDGKFYCNVCGANAMGVDTGDDKSCMNDGGTLGKPCSNDIECGKGLKCCYPCGVPGCQNQCTKPEPNGMCPLYP